MDDVRTVITEVGARLAIPRHAPANSFVLHAPLELLARAGLYPLVAPEARGDALDQIRALGDKYDAAGDPVEPPAAVAIDSVDDAVRHLIDALTAGDLDDVDALATWLGARIDAVTLQRALAEPIAGSLAAAAHGSILLDLLPRIALASDVTTAIVRGPARELARYPAWRLRWFEDPDGIANGPSTLRDALLAVPMLGVPGSDFIFPIMHQAEESGIATKLLAGFTRPGAIEPSAAGRDLARLAAWSMLQEPGDHAPYGWSHCLTMPQSVIALAGRGASPRTAVAVAGTHVVGFRAALGQRTIDPERRPTPRPGLAISDAIDASRGDAAAVAWHCSDADRPAVVTELATRAARHEDAHLVKYTLACFDAAANDPQHDRLYLAAAASLHAWWAAVDRAAA